MSTGLKGSVSTDDPRPRAPREPEPDDCCGEGCVRCVYDVYDNKMERYKTALAAWLERHPEAEPAPDRGDRRRSRCGGRQPFAFATTRGY